jgi:hypothetical protein
MQPDISTGLTDAELDSAVKVSACLKQLTSEIFNLQHQCERLLLLPSTKQGLKRIHQHGYVLGDVSPSNMRVDPSTQKVRVPLLSHVRQPWQPVYTTPEPKVAGSNSDTTH